MSEGTWLTGLRDYHQDVRGEKATTHARFLEFVDPARLAGWTAATTLAAVGAGATALVVQGGLPVGALGRPLDHVATLRRPATFLTYVVAIGVVKWVSALGWQLSLVPDAVAESDDGAIDHVEALTNGVSFLLFKAVGFFLVTFALGISPVLALAVVALWVVFRVVVHGLPLLVTHDPPRAAWVVPVAGVTVAVGVGSLLIVGGVGSVDSYVVVLLYAIPLLAISDSGANFPQMYRDELTEDGSTGGELTEDVLAERIADLVNRKQEIERRAPEDVEIGDEILRSMGTEVDVPDSDDPARKFESLDDLADAETWAEAYERHLDARDRILGAEETVDPEKAGPLIEWSHPSSFDGPEAALDANEMLLATTEGEVPEKVVMDHLDSDGSSVADGYVWLASQFADEEGASSASAEGEARGDVPHEEES